MSRTQAVPYVGVDAIVKLTLQPGGAEFTLKNSDWELTLKNMIKEAPNTTDGMLRAPGLADYSGKVSGHTDVALPANAIEANVVPGSIFGFKLYRSNGASTYFAGNLIVGEDLSIKTGVDSTEDWDFSFAKCYGPLIFPGGTAF